jgi:hypothetical protein
MLDLGRIGLLCIYIFTDIARPDVYMYLVFLSVFGIFNYLRLVKTLRVFIELFKACFKDMFSFIIILVVLIVAFNSAFYVRNQVCPDYENCWAGNPVSNDDSEWVGKPDLFSQFKYSLELAFMDNNAINEQVFQTPQYFLYILQVIIIALVMMNLLIAIISDTYAKVMEKVEQSANSVLCDIILELETFCFWARGSKDYGYVCFAEYLESPKEEGLEDKVS